MESSRASFVRRMLRQVHLWIGLGLGLLFVPLGLSGAMLVFGTELDRFLEPSRYAVTSGGIERTAGVYLANAVAAAPGSRAVVLRWPLSTDMPVTVLLRSSGQTRVAYLDPPTGNILGIAGSSDSVVGFAHALHANLMVDGLTGRQIVGWIGTGLLVMALSGAFIWWPRFGGMLRALRWQRGSNVSLNLHRTLGFWIAGPLAVMTLTGIYLSFPQQSRAVIAIFTELTPQAPRPMPGIEPIRQPTQDPQRVIELALQSGEGLSPVSLSPPTEQSKFWRVQVSKTGGVSQTVLVDDATSAITSTRQSTTGDAFTAWLRRVHEAKHHGAAWRLIAFLCGVAPAFLLVTGTIIWLSRRGPAALSLLRRGRRFRGFRASRPSNL
ncbi:PepSY-associated TM helix domain-containing protein [Methylocapsa sp. D3K7]|uniref:PepSY-associated TM helix domain-containing protein n=1 Tax=Methylocapsa sp. D3K7 TaxID=3041435 RepID=UPI00244EE1A8|nr:PepSY-associated TM helix domain-containing protein [Methylocapsa sp. D3K7]WGJ13131.1 PepSY-associated TM helix domain-containing protein [Methylocapsa sp. D3K7]